MLASSQARARDDIVGLVHRTTDVHRLARDVMRILQRAVPFDGVWLSSLDPATLLPTARVVSRDIDPAVLPRLIEIELGEPDFIKYRAMVRQGCRAASLSEATRGDLEQSVRYRELRRPTGFDDEARVLCSNSTGDLGCPNPAA